MERLRYPRSRNLLGSRHFELVIGYDVEGGFIGRLDTGTFLYPVYVFVSL